MEQNVIGKSENEENMQLYVDGKLNIGAIYSYHTFVYPFSLENGKLELEKNGWKKKDTTFNKDEYSNYVYYNNEGRRLLYSQEEIVEYYREFDKNKSFYEIECVITKKIKDKDKYVKEFKAYELPCTRIRLKEYSKRIYLFIIEVANNKYNSEEDIKRINDIGRRLYYPYVEKEPNKEIKKLNEEEKQYKEDIDRIKAERNKYYSEKNKNLKEDIGMLNSICPLKLNLILDNKEYPLELHKEINEILKVAKITDLDNIIIPHFVKELLGLTDGKLYDLDSIVDERMLITCCINSYKALELEEISKKTKIEKLKSIYEFAYSDYKGGCSFQNELLLKDEIEKASYKRWEDYGSYYFISTTGLVSIIKADEKYLHLIESSIYKYNEIYYVALLQQMALLYLNKTINVNQLNAYKLYNEFSNLIDFDIITTQIQGIEMFNQMREILGNENLKNKIQEKIGRIHNKDLEEKTDKLTYTTNLLTIFVTLAAVFSSIASIPFSHKLFNIVFFIFSAIISLVGSIIFIAKIQKNKKQ